MCCKQCNKHTNNKAIILRRQACSHFPDLFGLISKNISEFENFDFIGHFRFFFKNNVCVLGRYADHGIVRRLAESKAPKARPLHKFEQLIEMCSYNVPEFQRFLGLNFSMPNT